MDYHTFILYFDRGYAVINIIYQNDEMLKVFSKVQLNDNLKIINQSFKGININEEDSLMQLIKELKNTYEDSWKNLNIINTSIKLPIRVLLSSKENEKIRLFENILNNLYMVSSYNVILFDNNDVVYKIIYNGSPKKFLSEIKKNNLIIEKENQNWRVK